MTLFDEFKAAADQGDDLDHQLKVLERKTSEVTAQKRDSVNTKVALLKQIGVVVTTNGSIYRFDEAKFLAHPDAVKMLLYSYNNEGRTPTGIILHLVSRYDISIRVVAAIWNFFDSPTGPSTVADNFTKADLLKLVEMMVAKCLRHRSTVRKVIERVIKHIPNFKVESDISTFDLEDPVDAYLATFLPVAP